MSELNGRPALLDVRHLRITTGMAGRERTLVADCSFSVAAGESIAIVGESGSGKSLSARAAIGLLPDGLTASGEVLFKGQNLLAGTRRDLTARRGTELALVLQDPFTTLNPLARCWKQITDGPRQSGLGRSERRSLAVARLAEVGIADPDVADRYPFQLSGGMRQRVALSAALAGDPDVLIADEFSTALDVTTQREIMLMLERLCAARGMALVLITHDLRMAFSMCDRVYVLYAGSLLEVGRAGDIEAEPLHPYTLGLLMSEPDARAPRARLAEMEGCVPEPDLVAATCPFADRCSWAAAACQQPPALREPVPGRLTACARIDEIRGEMRHHRRAVRAGAPLGAAPGVASDGAGLVRISELRKTFHDRSGKAVHALGGVTLDLGSGECVGIVGESGSGKTTLSRCLVGLDRPTSGAIAVDGCDVSDWRALARDERRRLRQTIQYVFQDPYSSLNPTRTVAATLAEAVEAGPAAGGQTAQRVLALLELVRLPAAYRDRKPAALSGGERQRVAIARALAVEPRVIVCDEPVSALDVSVQAQILNLLGEIRSATDVSYLFISHDLAVVRQIADRVYVLYKGLVVEDGPVDEILDRPRHPYTQQLIGAIPGRPASHGDYAART